MLGFSIKKNPVIPFREFDSDKPEEKEAQRFPMRFFEKKLVYHSDFPVYSSAAGFTETVFSVPVHEWENHT